MDWFTTGLQLPPTMAVNCCTDDPEEGSPTGATYKPCCRFRYMTRCSQSGAMVWPLNSTYHIKVHHRHWDGKPTGLPGHWYLKKERRFLAGVTCPWGLRPSQIHSFISIQPWRPGLAGTRAQSCYRYGSGTLHPGQVLGGSLPLLSPAFRRSHFSRQVPPSATTREILAPKGGTAGKKDVR